MTALVQVHDLAKTFDVSAPWLNRVVERKPRQFVHAVDGVSFAIERGRTLALVGESGCGKSTVARLLVGLYGPTRGRVEFDGQDTATLGDGAALRAVRRRMQMIFQDPYASLNPRWKVLDIVAEPLREHALVDGPEPQRARVSELLQSVGLAAADMEKFPHQFSGGQRQRISIARALATQPEFLVCDEPTSALDVSVQAQVLNIMKDLQRARGLTYLFISHNLAVVRHVSDEVGVMYLGRLVELAPKAELFARHQAVLAQRLGHDVQHLPARVQAGVRVLEDHLHAPAHRAQRRPVTQRGRVLAVELHASARGAVQAHQQPGHRALAAARFAHQGQRAAALDRKAHAVHRMHELARLALHHAVEPGGRDVEGLGQIVDLHQRGHACAPWATGATGASAPGHQQAARVAPAVWSSGRSCRQRSVAWGQRGLKAQPRGMAVKRGIAPSICSRRSRSSSMAGMEPMRPAV